MFVNHSICRGVLGIWPGVKLQKNKTLPNFVVISLEFNGIDKDIICFIT